MSVVLESGNRHGTRTCYNYKLSDGEYHGANPGCEGEQIEEEGVKGAMPRLEDH